jgi:hypothetical protein
MCWLVGSTKKPTVLTMTKSRLGSVYISENATYVMDVTSDSYWE